MRNINPFIKRHPVLTYYFLTFTISWGGFLLVGGRGLVSGNRWQSDPMFQLAILAMLAGPIISGILLTALVDGGAGFRGLRSRLLKWRVSARWYGVALMTVPTLAAVVLLALSLTSPIYLPAIVTSGDRVALLLSGIAVGLMGGFVEELGWTGFAIPRLRLRYSVLTTGIIVGVLWGVWHILQISWVSITSTGPLSLALFVPLYFFSAVAQLTAYRLLMVWVYDRTGSLLVTMLMHFSLIVTTLFILAPQATTGVSFLTYAWLLAAGLWAIVGAVFSVESRRLSRREQTPRAVTLTAAR